MIYFLFNILNMIRNEIKKFRRERCTSNARMDA